MPIELKKLDFTTFVENRGEMYNLLKENRARLAPWFWWADNKITPTKFRFYVFIGLYLTDTKRKQILHKLNPSKTYDEQFIIYNDSGKIAGMCGLDNIDTANKKDAELWGLAFKGQTQTMESAKILEDYCINTLNLNSIYGKVQSMNRACRLFWEKYGYDNKTVEQNVQVSKHNPNIADIYTYTRILTR